MNFIENLLSQRKAKITKDIRVLGIDLGTTNSTVAEVTLKSSPPQTCRTIEIDQPLVIDAPAFAPKQDMNP